MNKKSSKYVPWSLTQVPERTETYEPMPHLELLDLIKERLALQGYTIISREVSQNERGTVISFMMVVQSDRDEDMTLMFGGMNSYDKSRAIKIAAGAHVFICGNGMVVSDLFTFRKHTSKLRDDLTDLIDHVVSGLEDVWKRTVRDVKMMQSVAMTDEQVAELYGKLYIIEEIITSVELNKAVRELRSPSFDQFKEKTLWSAYNHVTFALKDAPPSRRLESLKALHEYVMDVAVDQNTVTPYGNRESLL